MAPEEPARHFYLPTEGAWVNLLHLQQRYTQGIVGTYTNTHAWGNILRVYFPQYFDSSQVQLQPGKTAQRTIYSVDGHLFDQGPPETDHGVGGGVTVERIMTDLPAYTKHHRDVLYVKCSPPSDNSDSQSQWIGAMRAAVASLGKRYASQAVYFILGVGLEWLPFYWDPNSPVPAGKALKMAAGRAVPGEIGEEASDWSDVNPKVHAPPGIDAGHVNAEGVVRTDRARSLDCLTVASSGAADEAPRLAFQADFDFLEEFLRVVESHAYVGEIEPDPE